MRFHWAEKTTPQRHDGLTGTEKRAKQGMALILAILTMLVLFIIGMEFYSNAFLEVRRAANTKRLAEERYAARVALQQGVAMLRQSSEHYGTGEPWYGKTATKIPYPDKDGERWYLMTCEDEDGRLNLNNPILSDEPILLFQLFGYPYYRAVALSKALGTRLKDTKIGQLDSIQEILFLPTFREEDPLRFLGENPTRKDLRQLATVFMGTEQRINVNTASADILFVYLALSSKQIQSVMSYRQMGRVFRDTKELEALGIKDTKKMKCTSQVFRIRTQGGSKDLPASCEVEAVVHLGNKREVTFLYYLEK